MSNSNHQHIIPKLCLKCRIMFANPAFKDMCSKCFRISEQQINLNINLQQKKQQTQPHQLQKQSIQPTPKQQPNPFKQSIIKIQQTNYQNNQSKYLKSQQKFPSLNKCTTCNKKTGLLGYSCTHCLSNYCKSHRLPQQHDCTVDFISLGQKKLKLENPPIKTPKITQI